MFEYSFVPSGAGQRPLFMATASVGEAFLIGVGLMVPLFFAQSLPERSLLNAIILPAVPLAPPPPPPVVMVKKPTVQAKVVRTFNPNGLVSPVVIPKEVAVIEDAPSMDMNVVEGGVPGGLPSGMVGIGAAGGIAGGVSLAAPPPPPPTLTQPSVANLPPPPSVIRQIKIGGDVQSAMLIKKIPPVYPLIARRSNITGKVILTAVIGTDGTVKNLSLVSGHPMLVEAAMQVVPHWLYKPTVLNGEPVEVITQIEVRFNLEH